MTYLVAAVGLSGAGKTTGLQHLARLCDGQYVYLGQTVLDAVRKQGTLPGPDNERIVRLALREEHGQGALVKLNSGKIVGYLEANVPVFLDAIFNLEELDLVRSISAPSPVYLVSISAPFSVRFKRVEARPNRSITASQLRTRDNTERNTLGIERVHAAATFTIVNDSSLETYHQRLEAFLGKITPP